MEFTSSQSQTINQIFTTVSETAKQNLNREINLSMRLNNDSISENNIKLTINMSICDNNRQISKIESNEMPKPPILNILPKTSGGISAKIIVYENGEYSTTTNVVFSIDFFDLKNCSNVTLEESPLAFHFIRANRKVGDNLYSSWNKPDFESCKYIVLWNRFFKLHDIKFSSSKKYYWVSHIIFANGYNIEEYDMGTFRDFLSRIKTRASQNQACDFLIYSNEINLKY